MLTVLSVGKSRVSPVLLTVAPSEGEPQKYGISEGEYLALGSPRPGDTLEGEREERLIALDEGHRARRAAANLLAFGDNNTASLMRKLKTRGFSHEAAEAATAAMVGRGYINEQAQLDRAVALAANRKLWGARRIADALTAKGYRRADVTAAIERAVACGEIDFAEVRLRLLEAKAGGATPMQKRAILYRYGHMAGEE